MYIKSVEMYQFESQAVKINCFSYDRVFYVGAYMGF